MVVLKLRHGRQQQESGDASVEQALSVVDRTLARQGVTRAAASSAADHGYGWIAEYIGGRFLCNASCEHGKLLVHFSNGYISSGPSHEVVTASDAVAEALRSEYGTKEVRIIDKH